MRDLAALTDAEISALVAGRGFRLMTYGDRHPDAYICRHGRIARPDANDHGCTWRPLVAATEVDDD